MSRRTKSVITLTLLGICCFLIAGYISKNWNEFKNLELSNPGYIIPLVLAIACNLYANGMLMTSVLRVFNIKLSAKESFGLVTLNRLGNYIAPLRLGASVRIVYLKQKFDLSITHFLSSVMAAYALQYLISSAVGAAALGVLALEDSSKWNIIGWLFIAMCIGIIGLIVITPIGILSFKSSNIFTRNFNNFTQGWFLIRKDRVTFISSAWWAFLTYVTFSVMTFFVFRIIGIEINVMEALFITAASSLTALVGLTPAGFGIHEALIVVSATSLGYSPVASLAAALIQRTVVVILVTILAPYYAGSLFSNKNIITIFKRGINKTNGHKA